ncbi:response regulator [Patescibacteria group bacterium]|nr:response regulator [Patescibacteria group bacterium]
MSIKVAIVEDDKSLLDAIAFELEEQGYEVTKDVDGESGVETIKNTKPDIILLDIIMPRMDGFEVLETLKKNEALQDIPVIILSNLGHDADVKKGIELGAKAYFIKASIDIEEMDDKIKEILEKNDSKKE